MQLALGRAGRRASARAPPKPGELSCSAGRGSRSLRAPHLCPKERRNRARGGRSRHLAGLLSQRSAPDPKRRQAARRTPVCRSSAPAHQAHPALLEGGRAASTLLPPDREPQPSPARPPVTAPQAGADRKPSRPCCLGQKSGPAPQPPAPQPLKDRSGDALPYSPWRAERAGKGPCGCPPPCGRRLRLHGRGRLLVARRWGHRLLEANRKRAARGRGISSGQRQTKVMHPTLCKNRFSQGH